VAFEAEVSHPGPVKPAVEAVAGVAPAIRQWTVAARAQKRNQIRAVRIVAGEAEGAVAANVAVGEKKTFFLMIVALPAQGVALLDKHQLFLVAVINVAGDAVSVPERGMNAPVAFTDNSELMTFVAVLGGCRGERNGSETAGQHENQDAGRPHMSILLSFVKGNGKHSGKRTLFLS